MSFYKHMEDLVSVINTDLEVWHAIAKNMYASDRAKIASHLFYPLHYIQDFKNVRMRTGAHKIAFIFKNYVIKLFHSDYRDFEDADSEYDLYNQSKLYGVEEFFPMTGKPKKFKLSDSSYVIAYYQQLCKGDKLCSSHDLICEASARYRDNDFPVLDSSAPISGILCEYYQEELVEKLEDFCDLFDINDIHCNNIAINTVDKTVKIFDFSGYYEDNYYE